MRLNPLRRARADLDGIPILPGDYPLIGHLPSTYDDPVGLLRHARATVGPLFWMRVGFGITTLVCLDEESLVALRNRATTSGVMRKAVAPFVGESLLVQDGPAHQHVRSAMNGPFTPRGLGQGEAAALLADLIHDRVRAWPGRREVRILAETRELALSLIFRLMGLQVEELPLWRRKYEDFVMGALPIKLDVPGSPRWRSLRGRAWLSAGLRRLIGGVRAGGTMSGVLTQLVHARDAEGQPLSDQELMDNFLLLTVAGHETTASAMAWMVLYLAQDPARWDRLVAEAAGGEMPRHPRDLKKFPYAEALFRESVRLHPPAAMLPREVSGPLTLLGRDIPVGTHVSVPLCWLSRDPGRYPEPDRFRPERWLERREPLTPLETLQFGGGPHFCLGYHVAWTESVQFAVALGQVLGRAGLRPRLTGPFPRTIYLPLGRPPTRTRVLLSP